METLFVLGTYAWEFTFALHPTAYEVEKQSSAFIHLVWVTTEFSCLLCSGRSFLCDIPNGRYFAFITHSSFSSFICFIYWFTFPPFILVKVSYWIFGNETSPVFSVTLKKKKKKAHIYVFCNIFVFLPQASYHWSFREPGTSCLERKRLKGVMMNVHKHIKECPWKRKGTNYLH